MRATVKALTVLHLVMHSQKFTGNKITLVNKVHLSTTRDFPLPERIRPSQTKVSAKMQPTRTYARCVTTPVRMPDPRSTTPTVQTRIPAENSPAAGVDYSAAELAAWLEFNQHLTDAKPVFCVPADRLQEFRAKPISNFYRDPDFGFLQHLQRTKPKRAAGSYTKDRSSISVFERFSPRPPGFPPIGQHWPGPAIGALTDDYMTAWLANAIAADKSVGYMEGLFGHLRGILNHAVRTGVIEMSPCPIWPDVDNDETGNQIWQRNGETIETTIETVFNALPVDLRDAFVLSVDVGARSADLFTLRWQSIDLVESGPFVQYRARKTRKLQKVPLTPAAAERLRKRKAESMLTAETDPVFPILGSVDSAQPEKTRAARQRNARVKQALSECGLNILQSKPVDRPWQVSRKTANERWCRVFPQAGEFVLGHASSVNSKHYREPTDLIWKAAAEIPTPECFYP